MEWKVLFEALKHEILGASKPCWVLRRSMASLTDPLLFRAGPHHARAELDVVVTVVLLGPGDLLPLLLQTVLSRLLLLDTLLKIPLEGERSETAVQLEGLYCIIACCVCLRNKTGNMCVYVCVCMCVCVCVCV